MGPCNTNIVLVFTYVTYKSSRTLTVYHSDQITTPPPTAQPIPLSSVSPQTSVACPERRVLLPCIARRRGSRSRVTAPHASPRRGGGPSSPPVPCRSVHAGVRREATAGWHHVQALSPPPALRRSHRRPLSPPWRLLPSSPPHDGVVQHLLSPPWGR